MFIDRFGTRAIQIGALIVVLIFMGLTLAYCGERAAAGKARKEASVAQATGEALDRVAEETPAIRQDQQEKQDEVEKLNGAGLRLPDNFGRDLERVRRGTGEPRNP